MIKIHRTAEVSKKAKVGDGSLVWNQAQIREGAKIGKNCIIGKNVYIDTGVTLGNNVKVENNVSIYRNAQIKDGVFIGPGVSFTNDKIPRAINPDGHLKKSKDWIVGLTVVEEGASIGANSVLLPDIKIGQFVVIGAGSVVTKSLPEHALAYGNPAKIKGYVCVCGSRISRTRRIKTCHKCKAAKL